MISYPYPKYLNAIMEVDQSAGVLIASVKKARELGVPEDRWVYLHGCADAVGPLVSAGPAELPLQPRHPPHRRAGFGDGGASGWARSTLSTSIPASPWRWRWRRRNWASLDDPRGLTVTGGLPYAGGPGNNYAMHSIAVMMEKLRARPGTPTASSPPTAGS